MIPYPKIDPTLFSFGKIAIRWYSLMYVFGYIIGYRIWKSRKNKGLFPVSAQALDNLPTYMILGMLLGARIFYVFIYNWDFYSENLSQILMVQNGGLSFHGAMVGMALSAMLFARNNKISKLCVIDTIGISAGPGLFLGRIGNFINGELYGRATDVSWSMIFPTDPKQIPRHPSQLYQGLTEGLLVWFILCGIQKWMLKKEIYRNGVLSACFFIFYGLCRFLVEYTREADEQLGYFGSAQFSMGQILCLLMMLYGTGQLFYVLKTQETLKFKK